MKLSWKLANLSVLPFDSLLSLLSYHGPGGFSRAPAWFSFKW